MQTNARAHTQFSILLDVLFLCSYAPSIIAIELGLIMRSHGDTQKSTCSFMSQKALEPNTKATGKHQTMKIWSTQSCNIACEFGKLAITFGRITFRAYNFMIQWLEQEFVENKQEECCLRIFTQLTMRQPACRTLWSSLLFVINLKHNKKFGF